MTEETEHNISLNNSILDTENPDTTIKPSIFKMASTTPLTPFNKQTVNNSQINDFMFTSAINLHLQQFSPDNPELWFAIAESDFLANRITSDAQKYNQLLKALPLTIATQLLDIINSPPEKDKYPTLKTAILKRFSESRQRQLKKLLCEKVLGDKKPSQLLREMRELAKNAVTDEVLHQLWTERLPEKIRPLLVVSENLQNLDALAETADRIMDAISGVTVMAIHNDSLLPKSQTSEVARLERQLMEMQLTLKSCQREIQNLVSSHQQTQRTLTELQMRQQHQPQQTQPFQHHSRSKSRSCNNRRNNGICYYHNNWGKDARHCTQPCRFKSPSSTTSNQGN